MFVGLGLGFRVNGFLIIVDNCLYAKLEVEFNYVIIGDVCCVDFGLLGECELI